MNKIYLGYEKKCKFLIGLLILFFTGINSVAAQSCPDNDIGFNNDITINTLTICEGVTTTTINGGAPAGSPGPTTYSWEVSTGSSTGPFSALSPDPASQNWTVTPAFYNTPNTYYFRRVVSNSDPAAVPLCDGASDVIKLVVNAIPPAPTAGSNGESPGICAGTDLTLTATVVASATYAWTGPNSFSASTRNAGVTNAQTNATGTYFVTASVDGCVSPAGSVDVTVNAIPATPTAGSNGESPGICAGTDLTLTATNVPGASYDWTGPNSFSANTRNSSVPNAQTNATGTYSVTATIDGCISPAGTVDVTVKPTPATPNAGSNTPVCIGSVLNLTASNVPGATGTNYNWTGDNGFSSPGQQNPSIPGVTASAATTYHVTVTLAGCISGVGSTVVAVNPLPTPTISAGGSTDICQGSSVVLTSSTASSYSWSSGQTTRSITVSASGSYSVTVTDGNGCVGTSPSTDVTVNPLPTPTVSAGGSTTFCQGGSVVLTSSLSSSYSWSSGQTTRSITVSASGSYSVTVTDGNGCVGTSPSTDVTVNPLPTPTISAGGPTTFCQGGSVVLTSTTASSYSWSSGQTTRAITVSASGSYSVTVTDGNGCVGTSPSTDVTVNPLPTPTVSAGGPTTFCQGGSVVLTSTTASSYSWSSGQTTRAITVSASGSYSVTVTDGNGCVGTSPSTDVTVNPLPTPTISAGGPTTFCQGGSVVLTSTTASSYSWSSGQTTRAITVSASGSYSVTVTDGNGCVGTSPSTDVTVNPLPTPTVSAGGPTTFCQGGSVVLTSTTASSYSWSSGQTTRAITVSASGSYSVTVTDGNGCVGTSPSTDVTVNPLPTPTITAGGPTTFCQGGSVILTSTTASSYSWSSGQTTRAITVSASGSYSVTVTDGNGCVGTSPSTSVTVNPLPTPTITAGGPTTFCQGGSVVLTSTTASSYSWSSGQTTRAITVNASGSYSVTVTDGNGCVGTSPSTDVTVNPLPTPTITAGGPTTFCQGGSVVLTSTTASSYSWSSGQTTRAITVSASGSYSVTVTDGNGCVGTSPSTSVTVNPLPTPTITAGGPTTFCQGGSVVLTSSLSSSYLWSTGATTRAITVNASGSYSVTVTDGNSCSATSAATPVTVTPTPATPTAGSNGVAPGGICQGTTLTLTATTVTGATYAWTGPNGFTSNVQNPTIVNAQTNATGTYSVVATISSCPGIAGTVSVLVKPNPPAPTVTGTPNPICTGATLTLNEGLLGDSYSWTGPAGFTSTILNPSITNVTSANGGIYSVAVTINGCTSPVGSMTPPGVVVNALPTITSNTGIFTLCIGTTLQLNGSGTKATLNPWVSGSTGVATVNTSGLVTGVAVGTSVITYTNNSGCSITQTVTVNPTPTTTASVGSQTICMSSPTGPATISPINFVTPAGAATYTWTRTNPGPGAGYLPALSNPNIPLSGSGPVSGILTNTQPAQGGACPPCVIAVAQTTTFTVTATLNGCTFTGPVATVTVNPRPNVSFLEFPNDQNSYSTCTGGLVAGNSENDIDVISGYRGDNTGQWMYSPNPGTVPFTVAPGPGNANVNQYVFNGSTIRTTPGTHSFFYQSNVGCISRSDTITLIISLSNNAPSVPSSNVTACGSGPVSFQVTTCGTGTSLKLYDADYTAPGGGNLLDSIGNPSNTFTVNPPVTTTYYVACINQSTKCESFRTAVTVTRNNVSRGVIAADQVLCAPLFDPALITETTAATGSGPLTYQWQSGTAGCAGAFTNIGGATGTTYDPPAITQTTTYRRIVTSTFNAVGCRDTTLCVTASYNNVAAGSVGSDQTNCSSFVPAPFTQTAGTGAVGGTLTYQWQYGTGGCAGTFTDIAGAMSATYSSPSVSATTNFIRLANSTINGVTCSIASNCVTTAVTGPNPGVIAGNQTICSGLTPAMLTETTPSTGGVGVPKYTWQVSTTSCTSGFSTAPGTSNMSTYQPPALIAIGGVTTTYNYRRNVTTGTAPVCSVLGNVCVSVTVTPAAVGGTLASGSACSGAGSLTLTAFAGGVTGWEFSTDGGTTWGPTGTASPTLNYTITQPTMFRAIVMNGTCGPVNSTVATIGIASTWTAGAGTANWNTAANWSDNTVPSTTCDVYIPGGPAPQPVINNVAATNPINNLHILSGATLTVTGLSSLLQIGGAVTNTGGTFDAHLGKVEFNGTPATGGAQTIAASEFLNNQINDLVISNSVGVTLNGPLDVFHSLTYGAAGTGFTTNGNLTLKSNATGTAWIGNMTGHTISGAVMVERYIPAKKAWRFLSVPVQGAPSIHVSWQENQPAGATAPIGFGTQITDNNAATWNANGFDNFFPNGPSIKSYNPLTNTYIGIPNTGISFSSALGGYMTFVRGDRTATTFLSSPTPTVLRAKGTLFTGTQNITLSAIPTPYMNPYAAPLNMPAISSSGNAFFYLWDPNRGGLYGLGAWQTLHFMNPNYVATPGGGSYPASSINNFIESGQAFLVSGAGSIAITELTKGVGNTFMAFRPSSAPDQELRTDLLAVNTDSSTLLADGTLSIFGDNYSNEVDGMDAKKMVNLGENLSIRTGDKLLVIERRHTITQNDTVFLNFAGERVLPYQFRFVATNFKPGVEGFLEDSYLQSRTPLNLAGNTVVNFTIENIPGSYAPDRFRIVFAPSVVLPVTFTSLKAYRQDQNINVEWKVENEMNIRQYDVEKSTDGVQFTRLAVVPPTGNSGHAATYVSPDVNPVEGYNYYRVMSVDINGKSAYSNVVKVLMGSIKHDITINPNPIRDGIIHLQFVNQPEGRYGIRLLNKLGQVMMSKQISRANGSNIEDIKWDYNVAHGVYQLEVKKPDGGIKNINVLY